MRQLSDRAGALYTPQSGTGWYGDKTGGIYPWSGHWAYLGKEILPWLTTDWTFSQFGKSTGKALAAYMAFVLDGSGEGSRSDFYGAGVDSRLLGDDSFMNKCLSASGDVPICFTAQDIVDKVCRAYNVDISVLKTKSQQRILSEARTVAGWLARESGCVTLSDIARLVNRDIGSISSSVRRLTNRIQEEPELASRVIPLKADIEE